MFRKLFGFIVLVGFSVSAMAYDSLVTPELNPNTVLLSSEGLSRDEYQIGKIYYTNVIDLDNGDIKYFEVKSIHRDIALTEKANKEIVPFDKYNIIVIDRKKPYRIRPILEFSKNLKGNGRFVTHSVKEHITKRKNKNIIAAINGDSFSHDDGTSSYVDGKLGFPSSTLIYNGIYITDKISTTNNPNKSEAMLYFDNNYAALNIGQLFHNIGTVRPYHNFSEKIRCQFGEQENGVL